MRLKRSALRVCEQCKERKYLDMKADYGGRRYMDRWAIECVWCGNRGPFEYSQQEAIDAWNGKSKPPVAL